MIDFMKSWVGSIAAMIVFVSLLEILLPLKNMKKYISVITSLIIVLTLAKPLIFLKGSLKNITDNINKYSSVFDENNYEVTSSTLENYNDAAAQEIFKQSVTSYIEKDLDMELTINTIDVEIKSENMEDAVVTIELANSNITTSDQENIRSTVSKLLDLEERNIQIILK